MMGALLEVKDTDVGEQKLYSHGSFFFFLTGNRQTINKE